MKSGKTLSFQLQFDWQNNKTENPHHKKEQKQKKHKYKTT